MIVRQQNYNLQFSRLSEAFAACQECVSPVKFYVTMLTA